MNLNMTSGSIRDRCIECGDTVDDASCGWGESYLCLCRLHGLAAWGLHISRCESYLQKGMRCARPSGHELPHVRYPLAWS